MASAFPLEQHITCSVCLEIYTTPYALKCLHTYCYQCLQNLKQGNRVQCPDCRKFTNINDIKKEFKIQNFVDLHKTSTSVSDEAFSTKTVCYICTNPKKVIDSFCEECEDLMCNDCTTAHQGSKLSRNHKLISLESYLALKQQEIVNEIAQLNKEKLPIHLKWENTKVLTEAIHGAQKQQITDINKIREDAKRNVDEHLNILIHQVECINQNLIQNLEHLGGLYTKGEEMIENKVRILEDVSQSEDISLLLDTLKNLSENMAKAKEEIHLNLPKGNPQLKSPISVEKNAEWSAQPCAYIRVAGLKQVCFSLVGIKYTIWKFYMKLLLAFSEFPDYQR